MFQLCSFLIRKELPQNSCYHHLLSFSSLSFLYFKKNLIPLSISSPRTSQLVLFQPFYLFPLGYTNSLINTPLVNAHPNFHPRYLFFICFLLAFYFSFIPPPIFSNLNCRIRALALGLPPLCPLITANMILISSYITLTSSISKFFCST